MYFLKDGVGMSNVMVVNKPKRFPFLTTPTLHGGREKILIGFILIILELEVFLHNSTVGLFVPYATASIGTNLMYN